jgi:hypothetical protein
LQALVGPRITVPASCQGLIYGHAQKLIGAFCII